LGSSGEGPKLRRFGGIEWRNVADSLDEVLLIENVAEAWSESFGMEVEKLSRARPSGFVGGGFGIEGAEVKRGKNLFHERILS
jgi:hypothetical protein